MEIQTHQELLEQLQQYEGSRLTITFTQWDSDADDEEVTVTNGTLTLVRLTDNEFEEKDLLLQFTDGDEAFEILMEIPMDESDLAVRDEDALRIFGTEAELQLSR